MAAPITPSKKAATALNKLNFSEANKENNDSGIAVKVEGIPELELPVEPVKVETAPGIKAEEANEPLLQENPNRFVLFPIQHHEVSTYHPPRDAI